MRDESNSAALSAGLLIHAHYTLASYLPRSESPSVSINHTQRDFDLDRGGAFDITHTQPLIYDDRRSQEVFRSARGIVNGLLE